MLLICGEGARLAGPEFSQELLVSPGIELECDIPVPGIGGPAAAYIGSNPEAAAVEGIELKEGSGGAGPGLKPPGDLGLEEAMRLPVLLLPPEKVALLLVPSAKGTRFSESLPKPPRPWSAHET